MARHRIVAFALAFGEPAELGEAVGRDFLRRATQHLGPRVPQQYILQKSETELVKMYPPDVLLVECWAEVDDVFAAPNVALRDELVARCQQLLAEYAADDSLVEEYAIALIEDCDASSISGKKLRSIVPFLKADQAEFADSECENVLAQHLQYTKNDDAIIDWNGALVLDPGNDVHDIIQLLELANLQLLQYRRLDRDLDERMRRVEALLSSQAIGGLRRNRELSKAFREAIALRSSSLTQLEGIEREVKLIGEWYHARLYDLAARRLRIADWKTSIQRKMDTLEEVYSIISERFSVSKLHFLEMLQIILFFVLQVGWFVLILLELKYFTGALAAH